MQGPPGQSLPRVDADPVLRRAVLAVAAVPFAGRHSRRLLGSGRAVEGGQIRGQARVRPGLDGDIFVAFSPGALLGHIYGQPDGSSAAAGEADRLSIAGGGDGTVGDGPGVGCSRFRSRGKIAG